MPDTKVIKIDGIRSIKSFDEDKTREIVKKMNLSDRNLLTVQKQMDIAIKLYTKIEFPHSEVVVREINKKIKGYKQQDKEKKMSDTPLIKYDEVVQKMLECKLKCVYCDEKMYILYEQVREPKQWTLDRIDNEKGHSCENTHMCCLDCNLKRRTMIHEKFLFTKKMVITKEE